MSWLLNMRKDLSSVSYSVHYTLCLVFRLHCLQCTCTCTLIDLHIGRDTNIKEVSWLVLLLRYLLILLSYKDYHVHVIGANICFEWAELYIGPDLIYLSWQWTLLETIVIWPNVRVAKCIFIGIVFITPAIFWIKQYLQTDLFEP